MTESIQTSATEGANGIPAAALSEHRFRQTLDSLLEGCMLIGFDWTCLYVNEAAARQRLQRPENLLGRSIREVYPDIEKSEIFSRCRRAMHDRVHERFELPIIFPGAGEQWFEVSVHPVPEGIFVLSLDITSRKQTEAALRQSEECHRNISLTAREGIWTIDAQARTTFVNPEMARMLGSTVEEMNGRTLMDFVDESQMSAVQAYLARPSQGVAERHEFRLRRKDGTTLEAAVSTSPILDATGTYIGELAMITDATERNRRGRKLQRTLELLRASNHRLDFEKQLNQKIIETSPVGICIYDEAGNCVSANPAMARHIGATVPQVLMQNFRQLESWRRYGLLQLAAQTLTSSAPTSGEFKVTSSFGKELWLNFTFCAIESSGQKHLMLLTSDVTERKRSEELIWYQANFDALTSLPNRQMIRDRLAQEIKQSDRSGEPLALLLIDLDQFKEVNDTLGHDVGDALLKNAAMRILGCVRHSDAVARLGGDEFIIVLAGLSSIDYVGDIAQKIIHKLSEPYRLGNDTVYISASIGITVYPSDGGSIDSLMKNADQAMYAAKNSGRNRFSYFTAAMQEAAQKRLRLANDLREALRERQFKVYFQPIVAMATRRVHKAEALIRWFHPERGMVSPVDFISVAEETGVINDLGDWVFREAARWARLWSERCGSDFQISVNKSPKQFKAEGINYVEEWSQYLRQLGLSGSNIVIEITEGLLLKAEQDVIDKLLRFRDAGIQVAIDDFGTGYSSLSYLRKFHIDYLKIDRTFVRNLGVEPNDQSLCEAIIEMAHKLGLRVIAEGVETATQHQLLASAGCDYAQGFLYSHPVPPEQFEALVTF